MASCASFTSLDEYKVNPALFEDTQQVMAEQEKSAVDSKGNVEDGKAQFSRLKSMAELFNADKDNKKKPYFLLLSQKRKAVSESSVTPSMEE